MREAASARAARPLRAASTSTVILTALSATVALASALGPLAGLGAGAQAFADHDRDESAPRSCSRSPCTAFNPPGLVQLARTAARRHG